MTQANNTTVETDSNVNPTLVKGFDMGRGKYSKIAASFADKSMMLFDFSIEQAQRFGDALMSDMGRLNLTAETLKISKTDKDGMVKLTATESTGKNKVSETPALTLVAGIVEIEKAMTRIPDLKLSGCFELPKYLQFMPKDHLNK